MDQDNLFDVPEKIRSLSFIKIGGLTIVIFFLIFILWASFAQLSSAAMANGSVILPSKRQTVQHLEGGIIEEILVKDGDYVAKDQGLIILNNTLAQTNFNIIVQQYLSLLSRKCRLLSERDFLSSIDFSLLETENSYDFPVSEMIELEKRYFDTRKKMLTDQVNILGQQAQQIQKEIDGTQSQLDSALIQEEILSKQLVDQSTLYEAGVVSVLEYNQMRERHAQNSGQLGALTANIAKLEQSLIEIAIQKNQLKSNFLSEVVAELTNTDQEILDIYQRHTAAKDTLDRIVIKAPVSGIITGLNYYTEGGVIEPSRPILDIVPQNKQLIIEAQANPMDIDNIKVGQLVKVQLTSFSQKKVPPLDGELIYVAADQKIDEATGAPYFSVHVAFKDLEFLKTIELQPGMPASLQINTGSRTFFEYITYPILKVVQSSFKESS